MATKTTIPIMVGHVGASTPIPITLVEGKHRFTIDVSGDCLEAIEGMAVLVHAVCLEGDKPHLSLSLVDHISRGSADVPQDQDENSIDRSEL